ncbi:MAG: hypothetical protein QOD39_931 [Mycobacterium sp.]|jgi:hypothetical protein|nr:hypothetical protein [Mycobacterium sp.]
MTLYVWPRLPPASARALFADFLDADPVTLRAASSTSHPEAGPVAVGGVPVDDAIVGDVQRAVRELADGLGFPKELSRPAVASFDQPATRVLHECMSIVPADAASEEVWSFLSLVVLPDVAVWRFPARADERILGRPRNVFRRLWWRAETIGSDVIDVPGGLGEDELVNVMERPTLAANPRTARALAWTLFTRGGDVPVARSELMRDVSKRVLRRQAFVCMDALDDQQLQSVMDDCFTSSATSMTEAGVS